MNFHARAIAVAGIVLTSGAAIGQAAEPIACNTELGRQVFTLCSACHALDAGEAPREGPVLRGVFERKVAGDPAFRYSEALRASNWSWDAATLDRFLANPRRALPGTIMTFIGLKSAEERAAVVCYLREAAR